MNIDPQKVFIGLMDFFSCCGALLTFLLIGEVGQVVLGGIAISVSPARKPGPPFCSRAISSAT
jgi:hypothetical protein